MQHPAARAVFQAVLGHGCIVHHYCVSAMPPHHANYASEVHTDVPRSRVIPGYVTNVGLLLALDPFSERNGAFEIVPDSCTELALPTPDEFARRRSVAVAEPGDALFFNARSAHRGGHNQTDAWRYAIALHATRAYIRQLFDYCRMLPQATIEALPPHGQQFLGYFVRMATSMEEYRLPPDQRPTRAGQE
jgi:ectoine hydroxylase-related dioxygenase (phytanoyl-CoA dioxygenase family)